MICAIRPLAPLGAGLLACLCACGGSSATTVAASSSASGTHASVVVQATAKRGQRLTVRVRSTPTQRVSGSWADTCTGSVVARDAEDFAGRTPLEAAVPRSDTAACAVTATARLARSSRVTVTLVLGG